MDMETYNRARQLQNAMSEVVAIQENVKHVRISETDSLIIETDYGSIEVKNKTWIKQFSAFVNTLLEEESEMLNRQFDNL